MALEFYTDDTSYATYSVCFNPIQRSEVEVPLVNQPGFEDLVQWWEWAITGQDFTQILLILKQIKISD